ncbi:hypothetical protein D6_0138 [Aeromonas phage D6]|uniref:Uncharacterized protein n=1 Tax=Aeromonas phage D6 TaxID=2593322 RepID=A0A514TW93_9CAUD|nr:hypothetical protein PQC08_gp137 [Aeromonas phage D6]QDJ97298.1 hypothetical protein D6_0138 [Aeromonas phage D6]
MKTENKDELLIKQFMARKAFSPTDIIADILGPASVYYRKITKRFAEEVETLKKDLKHGIVHAEFPKEFCPVTGAHVEYVYIDPSDDHVYFSLASNRPAFENKLQHLRFSYTYLPTLAKIELGVKLAV